MSDTPHLLTFAEAAERIGVHEKKLRRWARARGSILVVGPTERQFITEDEADAIADLMKPRPVAS